MYLELSQAYHSMEKSGAKVQMMKGLMDWKYEAGMVKLPTTRSVFCSAKSVMEPPACSKPIQKKITKQERMTITAMRCHSSTVNPSIILFPAAAPACSSAADALASAVPSLLPLFLKKKLRI